MIRVADTITIDEKEIHQVHKFMLTHNEKR